MRDQHSRHVELLHFFRICLFHDSLVKVIKYYTEKKNISMWLSGLNPRSGCHYLTRTSCFGGCTYSIQFNFIQHIGPITTQKSSQGTNNAVTNYWTTQKSIIILTEHYNLILIRWEYISVPGMKSDFIKNQRRGKSKQCVPFFMVPVFN